jgi:hypothetical protein
VKNLAAKTADSIQQIVDHINGANRHKYIPSFPDSLVRGLSAPSQTLDEVMNTRNQYDTTDLIELPATDDARSLDVLSKTAPPQIESGGNHPYIDDPATFDRYVRTNFDMERLLREDEGAMSATAPAGSANKSNPKS